MSLWEWKAAIQEDYDEFACLQTVPQFAAIIQKKLAIECVDHQSKETKQHPHQSSSSVCNNGKPYVESQSKLRNHIKKSPPIDVKRSSSPIRINHNYNHNHNDSTSENSLIRQRPVFCFCKKIKWPPQIHMLWIM